MAVLKAAHTIFISYAIIRLCHRKYFFSVLILDQNRSEHVRNIRVAGDRISKNAYKIFIGRRQAEMALGGGGFIRLTRMEGRKQIPRIWDSVNYAWVVKQRLFSSIGHLPYSSVIHEQ